MMSDQSLIEELKQLRDEVKVQAHLFEMELKDKWEELEKNWPKFEAKLDDYLQQFGEFNEDFWVGNKQEVDQFMDDYKKLKEEADKK
jgi:hypothetical protein